MEVKFELKKEDILMKKEVFKSLSVSEEREATGGSFIWVPIVGPVISILVPEMLDNK